MMKKLTALLLAWAMLLSLSTAFAWSCPTCNSEMSGKFCAECGTKKPEEVICPSCGTNYGDAAPKFCMECGTKLGEAAAATATPAPAATAVPEEEPASDVFLYASEGSLSLVWIADGETEYRIHFFPKWHDSVEEDMTELNLSFGLEYKSTQGVFTINHMPPGQEFWVGVFDAQGNGDYVAYTPDLPVPAFDDCQAELMLQMLIRRTGVDDTSVSAFALADLEDGSGVTPGLYLACFYDNPGEEIKGFVQTVVETPMGDKYVSSVNNATIKAAAEDGFGWNFYDLSGHFMLMQDIYGTIPTGDYPVSLYIDGEHVGTAAFKVTEDAPAAATPIPAAAPTAEPAADPYGVEIIGIVENADGTATVTWSDANDNGPYEIDYLQKFSEDFYADRDAGTGRWYDTLEAPLGSFTLRYLVPGQDYWVCVYDADGYGQHMAYTPAKAQAFPEFTMTMDITPIWRMGEDADISVSEFSSAEIGTDASEHGLEVWIAHPQLARARDYRGVMAITSPMGDCIVERTFDFHLDQGQAKSVGWRFYDLGWYFGIMVNNYGAVPVGTYTVTFYCDGELVCSGTFNVTK